MTAPLPPSKFGKGSTYGGADPSQAGAGAVPPASAGHGVANIAPTPFGHGYANPADQGPPIQSAAYGTGPPSSTVPPPQFGTNFGPAQPTYAIAPNATRPPAPSSQRTWILLCGIAVIAVVAATIAFAATRPTSSGEAGHSGEGSQPHAGELSGSLDNWIESVCITGSFVDGQGGLPGSTGGGLCRSRAGHGVINISQFDSDYKLRNGIAMLNIKYYVAGIEPDGTAIAFSTLGGSADALKPLTQFGFTIISAPAR